ncbi:MAG: anaerobic sulfatase-maturation protein [Acidobacteriaceae bacterium]
MSIAPFHVLAKPIGPICNLDCKYCFYLEKETLYPQASKWAMPPDVLESYIRQYIEQQQTNEISFAWQGGEPTLLGVEYFQQVVALEAKYANGKRIHNAFQTNGVLLDDVWGRFLAENNFLVGISIDGPRELHDAYRVDKGGRSSFERVMRGIETLQRNRVEFNTLTTVHRANASSPLEVYHFLKEVGSGVMQFIPIVERATQHVTQDGLTLVTPTFDGQSRVTDWSVDPVQYGNFLCTIFDEWVRQDVGHQFVQLFDVSLQMWSGMPASLCIFRETCGSALAIEHCGDLYSCDHFVYPENRLGNIMEHPLEEFVSSPQQQKFGTDKRDLLPRQCRECDVRFACNGECPKHRFATTADGEPGLNYLCAAYKKFFRHIHPYMKFMANQLAHQLAPANVMQWVHAQDVTAAMAKAGRNDSCPCGSGKKFKRCCATAN